jgi:uncharacterized coiled-coil DUF342 family protein
MARKEAFYVGLAEPVAVRRNLLETSKALIQLLQKFEKLKDVRSEKHKAVSKLHELFKEISAELIEIKHDLPHYRISELPKKKEGRPKIVLPKKAKIIPKKQAKKVAPAMPKPKRASELDKLERELSSIEAKLKGI